MACRTIDKIWIGGALITAVVSLSIAVNKIPHHREFDISWSVAVFIVSELILIVKLPECVHCKLPKIILGVITCFLLVYPMWYIVNAQFQTKTVLIEKSNATVSGIVVDNSVFTNCGGYGKGCTSEVIGRRITYKYSVKKRVYEEVVNIPYDSTASQAYEKGSKVVIRYSTADHSVSELVGKADAVILGQ